MDRKVVLVVAFVVAATLVGSVVARELEGLLTSWEITPNKPYDLAVLRDGSTWIAVDDKVLAFDTDLGTYVSHQALFMVKPEFMMIAPDRDDMLWLSDQAGERIVRFNPDTQVFTAWQIPHPQFLTPCPPFAITPGPNGDIWFTTHNADLAIGRLNPDTGAFTRYLPPGGSSRGMPVEIAFDSHGIAWFTLDSHYGEPGLGRLDPDTGAITTWQNPYPGAMTPFGIVIVQDVIWFADHSISAIVRFDPAGEVFTVYPAPSSLVDFHFVTVGHDGRLYTAAMATAAIGAFDRSTGEYESRSLPSATSDPMGVTTAPNGQIWIAVDSIGSLDYGAVARFTPFGPAALAIGVPGETVDSAIGAGVANVLYGSLDGLQAFGNQLWHQGVDLVEGAPEADDHFGTAVASGDFDGDGYMDLAVGVGNEAIGDIEGAGAVQIFFGGSIAGLSATGDQLLHQDSPGIVDFAEEGDGFGLSLAAGDFNGDGFSDLAVGVPFEDVVTIANAGCVNVMYGWSGGLAGGLNQKIHQDSTGIQEVAEAWDLFGYSLASGDFDRDGYDDLVVGAMWETLGMSVNAGVAHVIPGSPSGLTADGDQLWSQEILDVTDHPEPDDQFGSSFAVGDFNGDGTDDLAIGAAGEEISGVIEAGAVHVLYGESKTGLGTAGQHFWHQDVYKVADGCEPGDFFGSHLAAADFDGDGYDDLAVGVPLEDIGGVIDAGAVNVLYGSENGLSTDYNQFWHQDSPGILSSQAEAFDRLGRVAAADFDFDGYDDLAIGVPGEGIGSVDRAGCVNVLYGSASGISAAREQLWHQDSEDVLDQAEEGDTFSWSIGPLRLPLRRFISLIIFVDGFESGDLAAWSASS